MPNFKDMLGKFAVSLIAESEQEVEGFIRGWLEGKLKDVTVVDLARAVQESTDLWDNSPSRYKEFALKMAQQHKELYSKYRTEITSDKVLKWLGEDRPDLASFIINDKSQRSQMWFDGMVDKIKLRLFEQGNEGT